jgi:class 3 adenylate cyclase
VFDEPVRGAIPDPPFFALPGIEQMRAFQRGLALSSPVTHLVGARLTQVGSGTAVISLPLSPWLELGDGTVDFKIAAWLAGYSAVLTTAPGGHEIIPASAAFHHLRPCTLSSESINARGRVLNTSRTFTVAEVLVEDALGRALAHVTCSAVVRPMQPPPPTPPPELHPIPAPTYSTPDPYRRPVAPDRFPALKQVEEAGGWQVMMLRLVSGQTPNPPAAELFGMRMADASPGSTTWVLRTSKWHCIDRHEVQGGIISALAHYAMTTATATFCSPGLHVGLIEQTLSFLGRVLPDGREIVARGQVIHRGDFVVATAHLTDADGREVALGHQTGLLTERGAPPRAQEPERVLATVMFTDLVGSTQRAEQLGDDRWRQLLEEHNDLVRRQLRIFKGREIKSVGDGFLATFDSPARAIQCARAIRDGVQQLGLDLRTGIHTGECELLGADIAGIAVHIASRVQTVAGPNEILVSSTVRELVTGSGLGFTDHGRHTLKGLEGDWQLFAVAG